MTAATLDKAATLTSKLATRSGPKNVVTPTKLADAYSSLANTIGISFTNTSQSISHTTNSCDQT
ncbi:MAG: hypothetical protein ACJ71K_21695 [Nitrososphaeraceae archaeon]